MLYHEDLFKIKPPMYCTTGVNIVLLQLAASMNNMSHS
jgi:hypothetical protein